MTSIANARVGLAGAVGLALLFPGSGWAAATVVHTLKQPLASYAPIYVAAAQGFDRDNGLKFDLIDIPTGAQNYGPLISGSLDVSSCVLDTVANLRMQGKNLISIYSLVDRPSVDLVLANAAMKGGITPQSPLKDRLRMLRGLKFGITTPHSPSDGFLRAILHEAGLDPEKDVQIVRIGSLAGLFAALKSGQIDGYVLSPPSPQQAEKAGVGKVFIDLSKGELPSLAHMDYMTLCSTNDFVERHPDTVRAFVKAIQQGNDWMRAHRGETEQIMQQPFPNVPSDVWAMSFPALMPTISEDGRFDAAQVANTYKIYLAIGQISKLPDANEGVTGTNRFLAK
ncbi:MAG: ABC transporter substrate-binding protein [Rhizomicrobium sp.]